MASSVPSPARRWPIGRILAGTLKWGAVAGVLALLALVVAVFVARAQLPSYDEMKASPAGQTIRMRAADGTVLVTLGPSYGEWIPYDQIPNIMRQAMVTVEDKRYRSHIGVDPLGMARAAKVRWDTGEWRQGGSTITQQLARNLFLTNSRTFGRKLREALLALALERKFSKDQILELYLNRVYFGGGAYGVDAASRTFFGHSGRTINLSEAAIIAGLVKAPSNYSPTADAEAARGRASVVIDLMQKNGVISPAAAASADPAQIRLQPPPKQNSVRYFTDWALPQLDTLIEETQAPIDVWTTLDLNMQAAGDRAIRANTPASAQGALVTLDRDGAVRAMIGGRDYVQSLYNRATQAQRQPGSAFKLFVYLAALESGIKPTDTVVDEPVTIDGWSPRNSGRTFSGPVSVREAFARSLNTVSAKLGEEVGFDTVADIAQRFGITTPINTRPAMVLGTADVRLIELTRAFAAVAAKGTSVTPYAITRVTTTGNRLLYEHVRDEPRVLVAPWVAAQMTDLLQAAVLTGTGRTAQIGRPVAGKTGTTTSSKDGWFVGFSSGLTTGVWMGRDNARPVPGLQGARAPAEAFHDFMLAATARRPVEPFTTEVPVPDWQIEPDAEAMGAEVAIEDRGQFVDENGFPLEDGTGGLPPPYGEQPAPTQDVPVPGDVDQQWLDGVLGRERRQVPVDSDRERLPPPPPPRERPREQPLPAPEEEELSPVYF